MEYAFSKLIKRRRPSVHIPSPDEGEEGREFAESMQQPVEQQQWLPMQDALGRQCWQNRLTGHITYDNSQPQIPPQQQQQPQRNPALARQGLRQEDATGKNKKHPAPAARAPAAVGVPFLGPPGAGAYVQPPIAYATSPVPYMPPTVSFVPSPVPMYPATPWNAGGAAAVSPVPAYLNPEQARNMSHQARRQKEEEERKRKKAQEGTWERYYTDDGRTFWQHTGTGKRMNRDPYV